MLASCFGKRKETRKIILRNGGNEEHADKKEDCKIHTHTTIFVTTELLAECTLCQPSTHVSQGLKAVTEFTVHSTLVVYVTKGMYEVQSH